MKWDRDKQKRKTVRLRLPVDVYEILRVEVALQSRKEYRPLDPPPPSGFVEFSVKLTEDACNRIRYAIEKCREMGSTITPDELISQLVREEL